MDVNSLVGLLLALVGIIGGQALEGGSFGSLFQLTAFLIVFTGTMGAILVQSPVELFVRSLRMLPWVLFPPPVPFGAMVQQVAGWSHSARREGLLSLERIVASQQDPFIKRGLQLVLDGTEPERLRGVLEVEIGGFETAQMEAARVWESAGGYAPTIGILGAVLGLIHVMENLSDPSKLGGGIAVAFVATIYGVGLANLVFLPMATKLKGHIGRQVTLREMIADGLVGIANGDNPRVIEGRMRGYFVVPGQ